MSVVFPFTVSVEIILLVFNGRSFSKLKYFLSETALNFLWGYLPPHNLDVMSVYIKLFPPPHWIQLRQSTSQSIIFTPTLSLWNFLLWRSLFLFLCPILIQLPYWLNQDPNFSKLIIPYVYSSSLIWIVYGVAMLQDTTQSPHPTFGISVKR